MYGISPKERMDKETYEKWIEKRSINSKGSKNPNYGNDALKKKLSENPELKINIILDQMDKTDVLKKLNLTM